MMYFVRVVMNRLHCTGTCLSSFFIFFRNCFARLLLPRFFLVRLCVGDVCFCLKEFGDEFANVRIKSSEYAFDDDRYDPIQNGDQNCYNANCREV